MTPLTMPAQDKPNKYIIDVPHTDIYFRTEKEILNVFGEPIIRDTTTVKGEPAILYVYFSADNNEIIWLIFLQFDKFFPELGYIKILNGKMIVSNITYLPRTDIEEKSKGIEIK